MKNHVFRPLWVAIGLVLFVLVMQKFLVPDDFGVHGESFTYNYYRLGNVQEWKDVSVKYQGKERCSRCHEENFEENQSSKHLNVQCENCHGPGIDHPKRVKKLVVDNSRELCLRCHGKLEYPNSKRGEMPSVDGDRHMRKRECSKCHDPHHPDLEDMS